MSEQMAPARYSAEQRREAINQLEKLWRNPMETPERRRKAKLAWRALTDSHARSYGDPATFVSAAPSRKPKKERGA